jgi:hypothetical protein
MSSTDEDQRSEYPARYEQEDNRGRRFESTDDGAHHRGPATCNNAGHNQWHEDQRREYPARYEQDNWKGRSKQQQLTNEAKSPPCNSPCDTELKNLSKEELLSLLQNLKKKNATTTKSNDEDSDNEETQFN